MNLKHCLLLIVFSVLLTACAFHPRSGKDIPPQLHHVFLETKNPYSSFTTQLKNMLTSLDIKLAKTKQGAAYIIKVDDYSFIQTNPSITTTILASSFVYTLSLKVSVLTTSGKTLTGPTAFSSSRTLVQNSSQVYTPGNATLTKQELQREILSKIYYWLASEEMRKNLKKQSIKRRHVY